MTITDAQSPDELGPEYYLAEWTRPPQSNPLQNLPCHVDRNLARWLYDEASIEIDIDGPPLSISRCARALFNYNLPANACVLLADNRPGRMPLHLRFATPMHSVGAWLSAVAPLGQAYEAQCDVVLDDGQWCSVTSRPGMLDRTRSGAPFMGAIAAPGRGIIEAWFDAIDPADQVNFMRIAISGLCFVPQGLPHGG